MNNFISKLKNEKINYFLLITFFINISMVIFYIFYTFENYFHTDAATKILLAKEVIQTGEMFPSGWYYVNNDIWVFFPHGLLIPLIKLFGFSYTTYAINSFVYLVVYIASAWFFINSYKLYMSSKLLFINIILLSLSYFYVTFVFGEIAYITSISFVFLSLGLIIRYIENSNNKYLIFLCILIFIFTIHNPQRSLIYYFLPIFASTIFLYFYTNNKKYNVIKIIISIVSSFLIASFVYYLIAQEVQIIKGANSLLFANYDRVISHVNIFINGLLNTFGLINQNQFSPFSFEGAVRLLNFIFFGLLLFTNYKIIKEVNFNKNINLTFIYLIFIFVPILFLYIFTLPLAQDETTFRYFYPSIIIFYFILIFYINRLGLMIAKKSIIIFLSFFILISNYSNYVKPYNNSENNHKKLSKYLVDNKLKYGFASYWHSYINNVLSRDLTQVYPVHLSEFVPFRWLSSERWFKRYKDYNKTFVVFTQTEFDQYSNKIFHKIKPIKIDSINGFKVAIFDRNIAYQLNRVYQAKIADGINFRKDGLPSFIKSVIGLSGYESTHRWSDGDKTKFIFETKLPSKLELEFTGTAFQSMKGKQLFIKIGKIEKNINIQNGYAKYNMVFDNVHSKFIEFIYENAKSPYELGLSGDKRKLAFAFNTIKIKELKR